VPANTALGVGRRLPGAVIGSVLVVAFAGMLGPTWGPVIAFGWLGAGALLLTRPGERILARGVLRYRPAAESWLAADVHRLAPRRRIDVDVAAHARGVFPLGGHTIAIGDQSLSAGRTPALQEAIQTAVAALCAGRTRSELPLMWWSAPWVLAKMTLGRALPRRWQSFFRVAVLPVLGMAVVTCLSHGQVAAAGLGGCVIADLAFAYAGSRPARSRGGCGICLRPPASPTLSRRPARARHPRVALGRRGVSAASCDALNTPRTYRFTDRAVGRVARAFPKHGPLRSSSWRSVS
jgi:hypothetical protein